MDAQISVNAKDVLGKVNFHIFGTMLENWGEPGRHVIYGGVWVGEDSSTPNLRGLRKDVLQATREMSPTIIRWPGGCPADVYHWFDGIGPREKRPQTLLSAYYSKDVEETNEFGTHEFMDFCRQVGADPYINTNVGTGTPEEAANWVEYCNSGVRSSFAFLLKSPEEASSRAGTSNHKARTRFSLMRAENGHPEPFDVKYWGIGNELYGDWEVGHMNAEKHARTVFEYAKLMRMVDPTIKIIAVGSESEGWNYPLLKNAGDYIDYISVHKYYLIDDYYNLVACPLEAERTFKQITNLIDAVAPKQRMIPFVRQEREKIKIAVDEWNVWHSEASPPKSTIIAGYQKLTLQDGLFTAGMFHVLANPFNNIGMACLCNLVNSGPSGPITTNEGTLYVNPQYLVFKLYRHHTGDVVLRSETEVDAYDAEISATGGLFGAPKKIERVPYLDCLATFDEKNEKLYLAVINRHKDQDIECTVNLQGFKTLRKGKIYELNAQDVTSANDFDSPNNVQIGQKKLASLAMPFDYVFIRHSVTVLEIRPGEST